MIDRGELFERWHSLAMLIGGRAAGKAQTFEAIQVSGGHEDAPPMPSALDWIERKELTGGMLRWLHELGAPGETVTQQMHSAIVEAKPPALGRLVMRMEEAEWLMKLRWTDGRHVRMLPDEADLNGRAQWERRIIMHYRGVRTEAAADELGLSIGKVRWVRRKHGLTITGERMYPCTLAPLDSCVACKDLNVYGDDYDEQEAA